VQYRRTKGRAPGIGKELDVEVPVLTFRLGENLVYA